MTRDVPKKARESSEMHEIERIQELMDMEEEVDQILEHQPGHEKADDEGRRTVATNTTK